MIMGGGRIAVYLTRSLQESGIGVSVIDRAPNAAEHLCDILPGANIVCGDATRAKSCWRRASARRTLLSRSPATTATISLPRSTRRSAPSARSSPRSTASTSPRYSKAPISTASSRRRSWSRKARATSARCTTDGQQDGDAYRLADGKVEALEFRVTEGAACIGIPLKSLKLKPNVLVCAVIRGDRKDNPRRRNHHLRR